MIVIGLTGSIAMGKTTVSGQFASLGARVISADAIVHQLLGPDGAAVAQVAGLFPDCREGSHISRKKLGEQVFRDEAALKKLEAVLHPLVQAEENRFVQQQREHGAKLAVLDIPLLFETGAESRCDYTVVVTAPQFLQRYRALGRMGMKEAQLKAVLARQMPDHEKRQRADFVVHTGLGRAYSYRQVKAIMQEVLE